MIHDGVITKPPLEEVLEHSPDFYNDYIIHFNPYHNPKNGQFASKKGSNGVVSKEKKSETKKVSKKSLNDAKQKTKNIIKEFKEGFNEGIQQAINDWNMQLIYQQNIDEFHRQQLIHQENVRLFNEQNQINELHNQINLQNQMINQFHMMHHF